MRGVRIGTHRSDVPVRIARPGHGRADRTSDREDARTNRLFATPSSVRYDGRHRCRSRRSMTTANEEKSHGHEAVHRSVPRVSPRLLGNAGALPGSRRKARARTPHQRAARLHRDLPRFFRPDGARVGRACADVRDLRRGLPALRGGLRGDGRSAVPPVRRGLPRLRGELPGDGGARPPSRLSRVRRPRRGATPRDGVGGHRLLFASERTGRAT